MKQIDEDEIRQNVRDSYSRVAKANDEGVSCGITSSCCGVPADPVNIDSGKLGYSPADLATIPEGADMGLGCGNPAALAQLKAGDTVLDLGSGGGLDCFLAAAQTGQSGQIIGVDMTPAMISKARKNAEKGAYTQVTFRLGEIEHLPVGDEQVDVIISNCVINLSPDKQQVFNEAFRVLVRGGRLAVSDVVISRELTEEMRNDLQLYSGCIAGASSVQSIRGWLENSGFTDILIKPKDESREFIKDWAPGHKAEDYVISASISAKKPAGKSCCQ